MNIKKLSLKRISLYLVLAAIVVGIVIAGTIKFWTLRGGAGMYSGEIIKVETDGFVLKNKQGNETKILTESDTKVVMGTKRFYEALRPGSRVLAVGVKNGQQAVQARMVRVLDWKNP